MAFMSGWFRNTFLPAATSAATFQAALGAPQTAITQTYSTADVTMPAATASTLVLTGTNIAAKTASLTLTDAVNTNAGTVATSLDQAQKDIGTAMNLITADVLAVKKLLNTVIDALQANGTLT